LRCATHLSTFLVIAISAGFLEPFEFDYDDRQRPMACEAGERIG
jgi:hypothetical protein